MKKFLSLVLALVMTMSLVTVSAGAKDFTDSTKINYSEAVDVMSAVKVIDGYTDGSFNPTATLTRGAAAKIICNLILGPTTASALVADAAPYKDVPTNHTFAGYIAYCQKTGIISGYADGTFKPANTLTGYAFMKMLLGALGYKAEVEGYTGPNWSINVAKQAINAGLNKGLKGDFNGVKAVTREEACLYAFNTLKATMVEYDTTITIAGVTVAGARKDVVNNASNETIKNDDKMQFAERYFTKLTKKSNVTDDFGRPAVTWVNNKVEVGTYVDYTTLVSSYTADVEGREVYNDIGSAAAKFEVTYWLDGVVDKKVSKAADLKIAKSEKDDLTNSGKGVLTEVYVDTDEETLTVVTINTYLAKVTADYNSKKEYVSVDVKGSKVDKIYLDDVAGIVDLKEDDMILVNIADGVILEVQAAKLVEDSAITKYKTGDYYVVSGTQYDQAENLKMIPTKLTDYNQDALKDFTYNLYLDQYGYVIGIEEYSGTAKYLFLVGYETSTSALSKKTATANAIFADGTMSEVKIDVSESKDNGVTLDGKVSNANTWYKYSEDKGVYTLKPATKTVTIADNAIGYTKINCKNVRLKDANGTAWGNDDSIYITVEAKANATDVGAAINKVFATYTGVQNVDLTVTKNDVIFDKSQNATTNITDCIWAVYDDDNYIIAAVVRGEDSSSSKGYAYAVKSAKSESYVKDDDAYYWDFEAVVEGKVETLTLKTEYEKVMTNAIDTVVGATEVGTPALMKLTYDKNGYVTDVALIDAMDTTTAAQNDKVYSNSNFGTDIDPDKFDAYEIPYDNAKNLKCVGRTLYVSDADVGLTLASGAPVVVLQKDAKGKLSIEEYTTISAALDALEDSSRFLGVIAADLNDKGTAEWIVIDSSTQLTETKKPSGSDAGELKKAALTKAANGTLTASWVDDGKYAGEKVNVTFYQVINGKSYEKETVAQTVGAGADHSTTSTVAINETGDYYAVIKVVNGTKVVAETATATVSFSK